jgi:arylsulfatase A-like enzyme
MSRTPNDMAESIDRRMSRRSFVGTAVAGAVGVAAAGMLPGDTATAAGSPRRPNILVVFSDQQRWDTVECYGAPLFPGLTPNLDQMARKGVRFQYAFTPQPVCAPARACLQTGRWATETGVIRNGIPLDPNEKTLARWLGEAGYDTGYVGKWHLGAPGSDTDKGLRFAVPPRYQGGYQYWLASNAPEHTSHSYDGFLFDGMMQRIDFPPDRYRVDVVTDYALDYLRSRDLKRPFFLFLSYLEPHHQNDHEHFEGPRGSKERFKNYRVPVDLPDSPMQGDWRAEMPDYLGCCHSLDGNLGRLHGQLKKMGVVDNTLTVYTTDHGCHFRTHEGEYKRSCHDNSIRIPMIVSGPDFTGGKVIDELVSLIDLPPTILSAGGITVPAAMRGHALQGLVKGTARDWPQEAFVQISEAGVGRAIRTRQWTYAVESPKGAGGAENKKEEAGRPGNGGSDVYVEKYLFDLRSDPGQHKNLVADPRYAVLRTELGGLLKRRMVLAGEKEPEIRPQGS